MVDCCRYSDSSWRPSHPSPDGDGSYCHPPRNRSEPVKAEANRNKQAARFIPILGMIIPNMGTIDFANSPGISNFDKTLLIVNKKTILQTMRNQNRQPS
jgi:hypothetical protein